jgi:hypothetical protein
MWAGLEAGVPTVNGYAGNTPPGWDLYRLGDGGPAGRRRLETALARWAEASGLDLARVARIHRPP